MAVDSGGNSSDRRTRCFFGRVMAVILFIVYCSFLLFIVYCLLLLFFVYQWMSCLFSSASRAFYGDLFVGIFGAKTSFLAEVDLSISVQM